MRSAWKLLEVPVRCTYGVSRFMRIQSAQIGIKLSVYNGLKLISVLVREGMVGLSVGNFVFTKFTGTQIHSRKRRRGGRKKSRLGIVCKRLGILLI